MKRFSPLVVLLFQPLLGCGASTSGSVSVLNRLAPGDRNSLWNRATNFAQAVYDVRTLEPNLSTLGFVVSYYDIDHLDAPDFTRSITFTAPPASPTRRPTTQINLISDSPSFSAYIRCQTLVCNSGSLIVKSNFSSTSHLADELRIDFNRSLMAEIYPKLSPNPVFSTENAEFNQYRSLASETPNFGVIEQFRVRGGFTNPFQLTLKYKDGTLLQWHGDRSGAAVSIKLLAGKGKNEEVSISNHVNFPDRQSLEICFDSNHPIQGIGVYGPTSPLVDPSKLCK